MKILTSEHPLQKKLDRLHDFMEKEQISFEWRGQDMVIIDKETGLQCYYRDREDFRQCPEVPNVMETVLVIPDS